MVRGETGKWSLAVTDPTTGQPVNLSGCSLRAAFWKTRPEPSVTADTGADLVLTSSPAAGIAISDPANGAADLTITDAQSGVLLADSYFFSVRMTTPSSERYDVESGTLRVFGGITHNT